MYENSFLYPPPFIVWCCGESNAGKKIAAAYQQFEKDGQLKYGLSSITVLNAETGEVVFASGENTGLAPASTLKTVTSVTAFNLLGKDFRWQTTLGYSGKVSNNVLDGDLIVTTSGDPSLGSSRYDQTGAPVILDRWASVIKNAGITKVNGRIVIDDQLFGSQTTPQGWIWQDIGNYYGAGSTAGNWRENQTGLLIRPGVRTGEPAVLSGTDPVISGLQLVNELKTGSPGSGDNVYAYSAPYSNLVYVRGSYGIDLKKTVMISVPDPAQLMGDELKLRLTRNGISISGAAVTTRRLNQDGAQVPVRTGEFDKYSSPDLQKIVYWLNQKSINLYAESILRTIALQEGKDASFQEGCRVMQSYWSKQQGIDTDAIDLLDGSGLSPENRITTLAMAKILQSAWKAPWFNSFYESLPLYNNMKMKSGSIRNVLAYAGYQKTREGTPLVFSFITNHYTGSTTPIRQKMFRMLDSLK
ncbi:D-alanyl-D-alanine carboxypeptidase/D-alanyl-D-alanine-endopeptidase [Arcticibacter sp. MXS-1]|uniref:D-alanyl-D-alanine carboxypeptidase/D-alanyl-D-alanine endopeptidase n=1 Tax=Arcticibacter sp. MXS-1 TaxID=3341726 RepID=UPI0035A941E3